MSMPIRFTWVSTPHVINARDADADAIGAALEKHAAENGGEIKTRRLHDEAKKRTHPMHRHLQWNDRLAGLEHRLTQIREMTACLRLVPVKRGEPPVRAFISIGSNNGRSYRSVADVLDSTSLQLRLMQQAIAELSSMEARFSDLEGLCTTLRVEREKLADEVRREADRRSKRRGGAAGEARPS